MMHCATMCLQRDPQPRPRMSQVRNKIEYEMFVENYDPRLNDFMQSF